LKAFEGSSGRGAFSKVSLFRMELVSTLAALAAFAPLSTDMYLPAFPSIERHFSADGGSVQLSLSSFFAAFAIGQLLFGPLSDRYGRRKPLYAGLLLFIGSSLACLAAPGISALIGLRFLQGLGACAGAVISMAIVRDVFSGRSAAKAFSLLAVVGGLAPMLAPTLGGIVLAVSNWQGIFLSLALIGLACLAAAHFRLPETAPSGRLSASPRAVALAYWGVLSNRSFLLCALGMGFGGAGMFAYIASSPFVFMEGFGVASWVYGAIFGCNALGLTLAAQLNAVLLRRFEPEKVLKAGALLQVCAGLALLASSLLKAGGLPGVLAPLFVYLFSLSLIRPNASAMAMAPFKACAGTASALLGASQFVLAAGASMAMGLFHSSSAVPMALAIAVCGVFACVFSFKAAKGARPISPADEAALEPPAIMD